MLSEHWEAVEADWQEHYGLGLAESVYGAEGGAGWMTARRVAVLTLNLPHGSRTMQAVEPDAVWTVDRQLAGLIVERLDALHYSFVKANGGKAGKPKGVVPRPKPSRRSRGPARGTEDVLAGLDRVLSAG